METPKKLENKLYTSSDLDKVIRKFEELFMILNLKLWYMIKPDLWIDWNDKIIDVKRWLADWNKKVFWDYLSTTHRLMEERIWNSFNQDEMCRCIRLIFDSGKTVTFSKDTTWKQPKWIINLDEYFLSLDSRTQEHFGKAIFQLSQIEKDHFSSEEYKNAINNILHSTDGELALALNLKAE